MYEDYLYSINYQSSSNNNNNNDIHTDEKHESNYNNMIPTNKQTTGALVVSNSKSNNNYNMTLNHELRQQQQQQQLQPQNPAYGQFRNSEIAITEMPGIPRFYKENHENQTVEHVIAMKAKYGRLDNGWFSIWDALEVMDGLVDSADPDVKTTQAVHALQTAEAARRDGQPDWFILTCLIHDLGKMLYFMGEPQWTVSFLFYFSDTICSLDGSIHVYNKSFFFGSC